MITPSLEQIVQVTDGLRHCVAYGATPQRLGTIDALRNMQGLPSFEGVPAPMAGSEIRDFILRAGIDGLTRPMVFHGASRPPELLGRCFRLELAFDRPSWTAQRRRLEVIRLLGTNHSLGYWTRPDGPEWHLLNLLARQLVDPIGELQLPLAFGERDWA